MQETGTDPAELRDGDRIMVQTMAGVVVDVTERAFWLDTGHGTRQYPKTAAWRHVADGPSCQRLLERLCAGSDSEGDASAAELSIPSGLDAPVADAQPVFVALTLEQKVELLRAVLRTPDQVPENVRRVVWSRDATVYRELACGLEVPKRVLQAAVGRGDASLQGLEPPRELHGHLYLGSFEVGDRLLICDPQNVDQNQALLINRTSATPGTWHTYARYPSGQIEDTVALLNVHEDHLDRAVERGTKLRSFTVESGHAAIVDARVLKQPERIERIKDGERWQEGMYDDYGATVRTLNGNGVYDSLVLRVSKKAVLVRLNLSGNPDHSHFRSVAATRAISEEKRRKEQLAADIAEAEAEAESGGAEMRDYTIYDTFEAGQIIRHPTFGTGRVADVKGDKIDVQFRERPRVLIHGRKRK